MFGRIEKDPYTTDVRMYGPVMLAQKRPALTNSRKILFHEDNAHTSIVTAKSSGSLEVLMHLLNSPDLVPMDYYLFLSTINDFFDEKVATNRMF